jgi:Ca2+/Na+ antiporter
MVSAEQLSLTVFYWIMMLFVLCLLPLYLIWLELKQSKNCPFVQLCGIYIVGHTDPWVG